MAGKPGMNKGNMGGQREKAGRLGKTARLKVGDSLYAVWHYPNGEWMSELLEVTKANRRTIELRYADGTTITMRRD